MGKLEIGQARQKSSEITAGSHRDIRRPRSGSCPGRLVEGLPADPAPSAEVCIYLDKPQKPKYTHTLENERRVEGRPCPRNNHGRFGRKSRVGNMYKDI